MKVFLLSLGPFVIEVLPMLLLWYIQVSKGKNILLSGLATHFVLTGIFSYYLQSESSAGRLQAPGDKPVIRDTLSHIVYLGFE